ncbi:hypothetical protein SEVIR_5G366700v4 [Setaria viridis]|uniref:Uncharacterized protein n=1 Tax=Setaria viridis TaxID=4556 RepID=A0A4U6UP95_SETVI|nr:hypothetical protein SEVIR_5G366700v2 [Setaria viridis]
MATWPNLIQAFSSTRHFHTRSHGSLPCLIPSPTAPFTQQISLSLWSQGVGLAAGELLRGEGWVWGSGLSCRGAAPWGRPGVGHRSLGPRGEPHWPTEELPHQGMTPTLPTPSSSATLCRCPPRPRQPPRRRRRSRPPRPPPLLLPCLHLRSRPGRHSSATARPGLGHRFPWARGEPHQPPEELLRG